jgi:hypothetical protein
MGGVRVGVDVLLDDVLGEGVSSSFRRPMVAKSEPEVMPLATDRL